MKTDPKIKSLIYVSLCVFFWALIPVVSKVGQAELDNHQFLFWSSLISLTTFIVILIFNKKSKRLILLSADKWVTAIALGFLGTYLYYILLYFGYANSTGLEVLIIQYCWPIFVILLSILILREKLSFKKIIAVLFGFTGIFLVLTKGELKGLNLSNFYVNFLVLLASLSFGLFSVLSKKSEIDSTILVTIYFLTATISSFISMLCFSSFMLPDLESFVPILINGIFVNGISYMFWIKALKLGNTSFIASYVFLTPILSTLFLIIFFDEPFQLVYIAGMASVIIGGIINSKTT